MWEIYGVIFRDELPSSDPGESLPESGES
jgi:hypothetical protein